ncbi:23S rRNA accumulation protein YceD [Aliiglaciecola sp. LCG003]|uniref:23S rRNA accumulation protein YceD n=1 Tax=Aliiglaciecola sp. LCG003 TaxID=3053655 RepID=UPI0025744150|nr:23S rRNA accumulation protein YceD [Aliiglaciecola sp. LCG003]WJG07748.1 23S rRNA accumulation protein YceD [Aliiglaciecola sp. LCG003]
MQKVKLPKLIDPVQSATKRSDYKGVMMSSEMDRLTGVVASIADTIDVEMRFDKDAQGLNFFQGHMSTEVELICQRCGDTFAHSIQATFCYSPIKGDEQDAANELPEVYEPVEVNDHGEINLLQLLEDELILSLPIVALHAEEDCKVKRDEMQFGEIEPADERPNPFAVLKELKRD